MAGNDDAARGCVFCGGRPLSKEHVWPQWVRRLVSDRGKVRYHRDVHDKRPGGGQQRSDWHDQDYNIQVRCVCVVCNSGWMSQLEQEASPFLSSLIQGRGRTLYQQGQEVIAAWCLKTAMMFNCRDRDDPISTEHHRYLMDHRVPPPTVQVFLGAYDRELDIDVQRHFAVTLTGSNGMSEGYGTTFTVRHLIIQVFGHDLPDVRRSISGSLADSLVEIWPYSDAPVTWPPAVLNASALAALSNVFNR